MFHFGHNLPARDCAYNRFVAFRIGSAVDLPVMKAARTRENVREIKSRQVQAFSIFW